MLFRSPAAGEYDRTVPFSCGVMQHHPESTFATSGWSWPFTRLDLRDDRVLAYTPVLFGRWALDVAYADIERAAVHPRRCGGRITLARTGAHDDHHSHRELHPNRRAPAR